MKCLPKNGLWVNTLTGKIGMGRTSISKIKKKKLRDVETVIIQHIQT